MKSGNRSAGCSNRKKQNAISLVATKTCGLFFLERNNDGIFIQPAFRQAGLIKKHTLGKI